MMAMTRYAPALFARRGVATLIALTFAACSKGGMGDIPSVSSAPSAPTPWASASAPAVAAHPSAAPTPAPSAVPGDPAMSLFGRMGIEAKNRPGVHPSVDDAFTALTAAGAVIPSPQQSLASTYKASYCKHGPTADHELSILVCEYPTAELMAPGLAEAKKLFPGMTARESFGHKTLLMVTTFLTDKTPPAVRDAQKKAVAAFNAL
jgi:hypothetical protein